MGVLRHSATPLSLLRAKHGRDCSSSISGPSHIVMIVNWVNKKRQGHPARLMLYPPPQTSCMLDGCQAQIWLDVVGVASCQFGRPCTERIESGQSNADCGRLKADVLVNLRQITDRQLKVDIRNWRWTNAEGRMRR